MTTSAAGGWAVEWKGSDGTSATTHAEHAALVLAPGETPHPSIAPDGLHAQFDGEIRITRAGRYRFGSDTEGGLVAFHWTGSAVGGGEGVRAGGGAAASIPGPAFGAAGETPSDASTVFTLWCDLQPGVLRLRVEFRRDGDAPARLRTSWEMAPDGFGGGFAAEPIPASAVRVPADRAADVERDLLARRGRIQWVELGCASCHDEGGAAGPDPVVDRRGPISLERIAARAGEPWLRRWLADPQSMKPGAGMPGLFGDSAADRADLDALVGFLGSLGSHDSQNSPGSGADATPAKSGNHTVDPAAATDAAVDEGLAERGRELFHELGCVACHGPFDPPAIAFHDDSLSTTLPEVTPPAPFGDLGGKWRLGELARFLKDPVAVRTHGRMPSLGLDDSEAAALAHFLGSRFGVAPPAADSEAAVLAALGAGTGVKSIWAKRGQAVYFERGCDKCHTLGGDRDRSGVPYEPPSGPDLDPTRGCLAGRDGDRGAAPRYALSEGVRAELRAEIESRKLRATAQSRRPDQPLSSPLDAAQRMLAALRCDACHERAGEDGIPGSLLPYFRSRAEADLGDEGRIPPRLDGVGLRLQSPWLRSVVADGARARPYFAARMPRFGAAAGELAARGLAALEGEWRSDDAAHAPPADAAIDESLALAGRRLAGSGGFNCVTCHSYGDRPSAGTPGLDVTQLGRRVREEWWQRYALSPLRFKPGTRMPTYFEAGSSAVSDVLDGDAARQIDALWEWFERAGSMPAPEGVPSGERMVLDVGDRPLVFRSFLQSAGNRGIAVGFPAGLHFAFDAEQIRLVEAWTGEFLDVAQVWQGRGGNVAPRLGPVAWSAPPGPALLLESPGAWPAGSGRDHGVKFLGYRLDPEGTPTFLYLLRPSSIPYDEPAGEGGVRVEESFRPDSRPGVLFTRRFEIRGSEAGRFLALQVDAKAREPSVENGRVHGPLERTEGPRVLSIAATDASAPLVVTIEYTQ